MNMKNLNLKKRIFLLLLVPVFTAQDMLSKNQPPMPRGSGGFDGGEVVGGSINQYIFILFIVGAIYAIWAINRKKTFKQIDLTPIT
jgi:hypothetical protein